MRAREIISQKRDGHKLSTEQIRWMVDGLLSEQVADYQWSALLMAIVWRGMDDEETAALTQAMMDSGVVLDLSDIPGVKVDKHSTGGVGDKTSLILAPIAAALGVPVPMVSGRGLGHTGGTLDKLEAIPGFRTEIDLSRYRAILAECGLVLIGQTRELAPADKRLYALRDATATVESIPLISASIMSKKLAEGIDGLVLDVKTGDGAFMTELPKSRSLAEKMVAIGRNCGKQVVALITRMDQPLGQAVGNALEVKECLDCLRGEGPDDLLDLSVELAAEMVLMASRAPTIEDARAACRQTLHDGSALTRFRRVVQAQGGDPRVIDDPSRLPGARRRIDLNADVSGFVGRLHARPIGIAAMLLGAGRARMDSVIDPAVGVILHKKVGDPVRPGEPLCTLHVNDESALEPALSMIRGAYHFADSPPLPSSLIVERL